MMTEAATFGLALGFFALLSGYVFAVVISLIRSASR